MEKKKNVSEIIGLQTTLRPILLTLLLSMHSKAETKQKSHNIKVYPFIIDLFISHWLSCLSIGLLCGRL
jgi:hypothetical protein